MVFEFVFPSSEKQNGFSRYMRSLATTTGLQLIEECTAATVVEGEWEAAMGFLRRCQEYFQKSATGSTAVTTVHIHH
jgi:hypothetical protein